MNKEYDNIPLITNLTDFNFMNEDNILTNNIKYFKELREDIINKKGNKLIYLVGKSGRNSLFYSLIKSLNNPYYIIKENIDLINELSKLIKIKFYDKNNKLSGEVRNIKEDFIILRTKEIESKFQIDSFLYYNLKKLNIIKNDWISIDLKTKEIRIIGTTKQEKVEPGKNLVAALNDEIMLHNTFSVDTNLFEYNKLYYGKIIEVPIYNHYLDTLINNEEIEIIPPLILIENILTEEELNIIETFSRNSYSPYFFIKSINKPKKEEIKYLEFKAYNSFQKEKIKELINK